MFSEKMNLLRISKKLTQQQLADAINMSQRTVAAWETGERKPSFEILCAIADYFNVTTDYLLGRTEIALCLSPDLSEEETKLINDYRLMNSQGQEYIRQTMFMALPIYKKRIDLPGMEVK